METRSPSANVQASSPVDISDSTARFEEALQNNPGITRSTLPEKVATLLRDMIVQNHLRPGERIPERAICAQLKVSRTPLREALKVLATEGLIDLVPNRGAVVASPSEDEIADMLQILGVLEGFAGRRACVSATDAELAEIRALHYEMLAAYSRGDRLEYFKLNQRIHLMIVAVARSDTLQALHDGLNARLYRIRYQSNLRNEHWGSAVDEHKAILGALEQRDAAGMEMLLRKHLKSTWEKVSEIVKDDQ